MAKKRIIKDYPRLDKSPESVGELTAYVQKLVRAMSENRPNLYAGDVHVKSVVPTDQDGKDGDVWIKY